MATNWLSVLGPCVLVLAAIQVRDAPMYRPAVGICRETKNLHNRHRLTEKKTGGVKTDMLALSFFSKASQSKIKLLIFHIFLWNGSMSLVCTDNSKI